MTIARILLPLGSRGTSAACADAAFGLADRFAAEVEAVHPSLPPLDRLRLPDESAAPMRIQRLIDEATEQAKAERQSAQKAFAAMAKGFAKVKSRFQTIEGDIAASIAARGRLADFTVLPAVTDGEGAFWTELREAALFDTGRPVLIAPKGKVSAKLGDTVVIAWKPGVEAARAVTAAKPLLAKAKRVRVVTVSEDGADKRALDDMAAYLKLLGLKPQAAMVKGRGGAAKLIMTEAAKAKDTILVMGAYSHWRWREWAFGGVTETLLHETPVPVLMTH